MSSFDLYQEIEAMKKLIVILSLATFSSNGFSQTESKSTTDTVNFEFSQKDLKVTELRVEMEKAVTSVTCCCLFYRPPINDPFGQRAPFSSRELEPMIRTLR